MNRSIDLDFTAFALAVVALFDLLDEEPDPDAVSVVATIGVAGGRCLRLHLDPIDPVWGTGTVHAEAIFDAADVDLEDVGTDCPPSEKSN